ncbi:MAG: hypothetical protein KF832_12900 [Caldilineaceae bacterium]|nr:hypothetical protein [Caldilineaceae bacterium]
MTYNHAYMNDSHHDDQDEIMDRFGLLDREERRARKPKNKQKAKKSQNEIVAQLTESAAGLEGGFQTTYIPARFEAVWLLDSLRVFYDQGLIVDVISQVKGGKEASVYLCKANPDTGLDLLAAKVYRPRQFRNLSNDMMYREGREILSSEGGIVKRRDSRSMRAMKKKTGFGAELLHGSWLMYEFGTLQRLHGMGAAVPKPIAHGENAILMEYIGNAKMAAPALHAVTLAPEERQPLFAEVMRNIELMLKHELIHGDLSAFNILYWEGKVTLIDFPQVTMAVSNRNAYNIFQRDVLRVCEYFQGQGIACSPTAMAEKLWWDYIGVEPGRMMSDEPA